MPGNVTSDILILLKLLQSSDLSFPAYLVTGISMRDCRMCDCSTMAASFGLTLITICFNQMSRVHTFTQFVTDLLVKLFSLVSLLKTFTKPNEVLCWLYISAETDFINYVIV